MSRVAPIELALVRALPWLAVGLAGALVVRLLPYRRRGSTPLITVFTVHLSAMLALVLVATLALTPLTSHEWFHDSGLSAAARLAASGASLTLLLTAGIALVSMASSAALGYRPSLSYLQLLSAADAGFATAGITVGLSWSLGPAPAAGAGALMAAACVWSIWRYLANVGFGSRGGWRVDRKALWRYVYPFDIAALSMTVAALALGASLAGSN